MIIEKGVAMGHLDAHPEEINVGVAERGVSVTLGAALLAFAAARRRPFSSLCLAAAGTWLAHRGITGRCAVYDQLDMGSAEAGDEERLRPGSHDDVSVEVGTTIARPPAEVYAFWRRLENLPRFMQGLVSVTERGGGQSQWIARGPAGETWEWEAELLEDRPAELLVWRSLPGSDVRHHGAVRFLEAPGGRGTEVRVDIEFAPPGGAAARLVARLGRRASAHRVAEDLRRLKQMMEAGETPISGFPRGRDGGGDAPDEAGA